MRSARSATQAIRAVVRASPIPRREQGAVAAVTDGAGQGVPPLALGARADGDDQADAGFDVARGAGPDGEVGGLTARVRGPGREGVRLHASIVALLSSSGQ